jgi:murein DD-endopeptidase MepM/ murein hydrolase activator NlpD
LVIHNSGVEITTNEGATARAVLVESSQYYGPVTGKQGGNDTTRDYFTIYQNLSSVSVNKGDKISIKQSLGRVRTNGDTGKTVIKFYYYRIPPTLIRKDGYPLNSYSLLNSTLKKSES